MVMNGTEPTLPDETSGAKRSNQAESYPNNKRTWLPVPCLSVPESHEEEEEEEVYDRDVYSCCVTHPMIFVGGGGSSSSGSRMGSYTGFTATHYSLIKDMPWQGVNLHHHHHPGTSPGPPFFLNPQHAGLFFYGTVL